MSYKIFLTLILIFGQSMSYANLGADIAERHYLATQALLDAKTCTATKKVAADHYDYTLITAFVVYAAAKKCKINISHCEQRNNHLDSVNCIFNSYL